MSIDFIIIALSIFLVVRIIKGMEAKLNAKEIAEKEAAEAAKKAAEEAEAAKKAEEEAAAAAKQQAILDTGGFENLVGGLSADTVNIGQSNFNALRIRNIYTSDTCHSLFHLSDSFANSAGLALLLLVLGVFANHHDSTFSLDDFALFANLFYGRFYFHVTIPFLSYLCIKLTSLSR